MLSSLSSEVVVPVLLELLDEEVELLVLELLLEELVVSDVLVVVSEFADPLLEVLDAVSVSFTTASLLSAILSDSVDGMADESSFDFVPLVCAVVSGRN